MADYYADGASDEFNAKEQRWSAVASEVRSTIVVLRESLESTDEIASEAMSRASKAVSSI
ncbi:MAG: hypothetical protein QM677_04055 [Microbacterium sp.]